MPLSGKKKKGRRKKKVSEEARERKKLDKWDTKAMKYILSIDMYSKIIHRLIPWYEGNEKLLSRYFLSVPCLFEVSLLEDFVRSILHTLGPDDPILVEMAEEESRPGNAVIAKNALYTSISAFTKGLMDLGAPYTEIEMHIFCRLIQYASTVKSPDNDDATTVVTEAASSEKDLLPSVGSGSKTPAAATTTDQPSEAEPPTLKHNPELFQDLIIKVSGALKILKAEELWAWELLRSDAPVMMKSKEQIPWVKDIIERRKAAEALKKKKKRKKKRPKSSKPEFERCKTCDLILKDTYSGPKASECGYVNVLCKFARREMNARHPLHVLVYAQAHWLMAQIGAAIIEQTELPTSKILLYPSPPILSPNPKAPVTNSTPSIANNISLLDFGCVGGSREDPADLTLYYDFRPPKVTTRCPILNAESLYDYGENKAYKEQNLACQIDYAKNYLKPRENLAALTHTHKAKRKGGDDDDDDDSSSEDSDSDS